MTSPLLSYWDENFYVHSISPRPVPSGKRPRTFAIDSLRSGVSNNFRDGVRWINWSLLTYRHRVLRGALRAVKNVHSSTPALVMGNGPSTSQLAPSDIKAFVQRGGHLFTVNNIFEYRELSDINIFCHTLSDPSSVDEVREHKSDMKKFLMSGKVNLLYVPENQVKNYGASLPQIEALAFCDVEIRTLGWKKSNSIRPDRPRSFLSLTVYKALALAIWMGHSPIYIVGFDNTYVRDLYCNPNNEIILRQRHCYGESDPGNYSGLYGSVSDLVYELALAFSDLHKFKGFSILNLDPYSLTDAFPKAHSVHDASTYLTG